MVSLLDALATRFEGQITMRLLVSSATGRKPSKHLYDCTQSHREIISAEMDTDHPKMMTIGLQESRQHTSEFSHWKDATFSIGKRSTMRYPCGVILNGPNGTASQILCSYLLAVPLTSWKIYPLWNVYGTTSALLKSRCHLRTIRCSTQPNTQRNTPRNNGGA